MARTSMGRSQKRCDFRWRLNRLRLACLAGPFKWFEASDSDRILSLHGMPQVPVKLESQPEVRRHPQDPFEPERGVRRYAATATHDLVEAWERDAQSDRKCRLTDTERTQKLLKEHLARMRRRPMRWQATSPARTCRDRLRPSGSQ